MRKIIVPFLLLAVYVLDAQTQLPNSSNPGSSPLPFNGQVSGAYFRLGNFYSLQDSYDDLNTQGQTALSAQAGSNNSFALGDTRHTFVRDAIKWLRVQHYNRHFKSHAFKRIPLCTQGELFFNLDYFNGIGCHDQNPPWIERIINDGHEQELQVGLYMQGMSDFFFQMNYQTSSPLIEPNQYSPCICRNRSVNNWQNPINIPPNINGGVPLPFVATDNFFEAIGTPEVPPLASFYLCVNCPTWRNQLLTRIDAMCAAGTDYILFDVDFMPESGCFCANCRKKFAEIACIDNPIPDCSQYELNDNQSQGNDFTSFLYGYDNGLSFPVPQQATMADLMHRSLMEHQTAILQTMHNHGTLAVTSTAEFPGLVSDAHRCALVRQLDMPKGEWTMPVKIANNRAFVVGDTLYSLPNVDIPEEIRIAGGIGVMRDVSKHRLPHIWVGNDWRPPLSTTSSASYHQLIQTNNERIRTWIGLGYTLGVVNSTTFSKFFDIGQRIIETKPEPWSQPVITVENYPLSTQLERWIWSWAPDYPIFQSESSTVPMVNPNLASTTHIFDLATKYSDLMRFKRPYNWVQVYYSEEERNKQLYKTGVGNKDRLKCVWTEQLLPVYHAFNTLYNFNHLDININTKYPVSFIVDSQEVSRDAVLVLSPSTNNVSSGLLNPNNTQVVQVPSYSEASHPYYSDQEQLLQNNLYQQLLNTVPAFSEPPFYIIGQDGTQANGFLAKDVLAGFFTVDPNLKGSQLEDMPSVTDRRHIVTVPLVVKPMWGLPRENWKKDPNSNTWIVEPIPFAASYNGNYDADAVVVPHDALTLMVNKDLLLSGGYIQEGVDYNCNFYAIIHFSDPALSTQVIPAVQSSIANYLSFKIPSFRHTAIVVVEASCK